ncbi:unnamed protein product [Amoebophrya sp. A25]|nr:unnamed protein product [Amoebophrya sp. A25]|eukprot:GSA25T00026158001.1
MAVTELFLYIAIGIAGAVLLVSSFVLFRACQRRKKIENLAGERRKKLQLGLMESGSRVGDGLKNKMKNSGSNSNPGSLLMEASTYSRNILTVLAKEDEIRVKNSSGPTGVESPSGVAEQDSADPSDSPVPVAVPRPRNTSEKKQKQEIPIREGKEAT